MVSIEPMATADIEAAARLRFAAFFEASARTMEEDAADLAALVASTDLQAALVARAQGAIVGTCLLVRAELEPAHDVSPWLAGLVVAEDWRGKGVGSALVRAIEARAAAAGIGTLYLYTHGARVFYEKLGWSVRDSVEYDGAPMLLMSRALPARAPANDIKSR